MGKKVNIISNLTNGAGLEKDSALMHKVFTERGHTVKMVQFDSRSAYRDAIQGAHLNVFLEVVVPGLMPCASQNFLVPNSEWWFDSAWLNCTSVFRKVLCKTKDCADIWSRKVGQHKCDYIEWEAADYYMPEVPRQPKFLHLAGKSETKNTAAVMEAWCKHNLPYPITVSAWKPDIVRCCKGVPNVTLVNRFNEEDMPRIYNEHQFFILPSKYEGWGFALHHALSCGAMVITTGAAPMKDFSGIHPFLLIPVASKKPVRAAIFNEVDPDQVAAAVRRAVSLLPEQIKDFSARARAGFLKDREHFRTTLPKVLTDAGF
jgi:hypothetical protein